MAYDDVDKNGVQLRVKFVLKMIILLVVVVQVINIYFTAGGNIYPQVNSNALGQEAGRYIGSWLAILIGWFLIAPFLVEEAGKYYRSKNWAFALGALFSILGGGLYLVYIKIVGPAMKSE